MSEQQGPDAVAGIDTINHIMGVVADYGVARSSYGVASQHEEWDEVKKLVTALARQVEQMRPVVVAARAVVASSEPHYITFAEEEPEWITSVSEDELTTLEHALDELDAATAPPDTP